MTQFPEPDADLDRLLESPSTPEARGSVDFPRLGALLSAAAAAPDPGPQPGEQTVLAAFRDLVTEAAGTPSLAAHRSRKVAQQRMYALIAATSTVVVMGGGIAAAAAGSLPGVAQSTAKTMLGVLGVSVPGPNANSDHHTDQRGSSGDHPAGPASATPDASQPTAPSHPTPQATHTPASVGTPPTPGNSATARHHGNPTPTATTHPTPGHGKPTASPTVGHRGHLHTPKPLPSSAVMHRYRPAISR